VSKHVSTVIVDGNNLFYKAFAVNEKNILKGTANDLGCVYITLTSIRRVLEKFRYKHVYITWDKPVFRGTHYRYKLTRNNYKLNRAPKPEKFYVLLDHCIELCRYLGLKTILPYRLEADDVVAWLTLKAEKPCVICTGDNDLLQLLVHDGVEVYNTGKDAFINKDNILTYYPVRADQVIRYKAFLGDTADNIDGIDGYGEVKSARMVENYEENVKKLSQEQRDKLVFNQKLVSLGYGLVCEEHRSTEVPFIQKQMEEQANLKPDYDTFFKKCEEYGFSSIANEKGRWKTLADQDRVNNILINMLSDFKK
jgi:5'-3' exonuclease